MSTRSTGRRAGRLVRRAMIFLAVGLGINIAVSWGLAAWLPQAGWQADVVSGREKPNGAFALFLTNYHTSGACRRAWNRETDLVDRLLTPFGSAIERSHEVYAFDDDSPLRGISWGQAEAVRSNAEAFAQDGCEHATGWPLLTAWCEWTFEWKAQSYAFVLDGGIPISGPPPGLFIDLETWRLRALPLRPIWPGLAANTILYAAIACGVWQVSSAILHARRRARGQCVRCGYDLARLALTSRCPECGLARESDGVAA